MDDITLSELINLIIQDKGGSHQQYNQLMDNIAYHETGPHSRMDPSTKQKGGGPGRGLFQLEEGPKMSGNTASNSLHNYLTSRGISIPSWLNDIWAGTKTVDASKLTPDQQKMLFLAHHRMREGSDFSQLWRGQISEPEFYAESHWAGSGGDPIKLYSKMNQYNESLMAKDYESNKSLAPWISPLLEQPEQSDFNITDLLGDVLNNQSSSLIKQSKSKSNYQHGGVHLPVAESDATYVQQPQFNIPIAQEEQYVDQFGSTGGSLYPSAPEPTLWEKIKNVGANPLAAFGYSARGEDIPWGNVPRHSNPFDTYALGLVNPAAWAESGEASMDAAREGDYLSAGLEGLGVLPYVGTAAHVAKKFAPQTSALLSKMGLGRIIKPKTKASDFPPIPTSTANINTYKAREIKNVVLKRKTYLLSDEYITKRAANTGESPNQIKAHIDTYLRELDNTTMGMYKEGDLGKNIYGDYGSKGVRINKDMSYEEILGTIDHEVGHLLSPVNRSARSGNPHTNVLWKDKKTGRRLTEAEAQAHKSELAFDANPKWQVWEDDYAKLYENYPTIKMEVKGDEEFAKYLMKPQEQQVRMVRYGEILKKHGWDGTKKGLTDDIINETMGSTASGPALGERNSLGKYLPDDVIQLLGRMKGIKVGTPQWYTQIKKTLPYAWGMAPVAVTQSKKKK